MKQNQNYSLAEISAQLIMPRLDIPQYLNDENYQLSIKRLCELNVGGFCVFNGDMQAVAKVTQELQNQVKIPLIFSADFENGLRMRLEDGTEFPHSLALGNSKDYESIGTIARAIALEARSIGIHWNLAPICDINSNPQNPIINIRAFGETVESINPAIEKYIYAHQSANVVACAKHFPGHGDTNIDSHLDLPIINKSYNELMSNEFQPFKKAIQCNVKSIMIGHILLPILDKYPSSLSKIIIQDILTKDLNYDGIIISDAFEMGAITKNYDYPHYIIKSKEAGVDVILLPESPEEIINIFAEKAEIDFNFEEIIRNSFSKLIELKEWCGLFEPYHGFESELSFIENEKLALKIAVNTIKSEGDLSLLPLDDDRRIAVFAYIDNDMDRPIAFFKYLSQAFQGECDFAFIDENFTSNNTHSFAELLDTSDFFIFAFFIRSKAFKGDIGINPDVKFWINSITKVKPVLAIFFGNPFISDEINANLKIHTFSDSIPSIAATVMQLCGRSTHTV